jgi:DNA polymerase-3 subunit delta'
MERVSHACILTGAGQEALFDAARERAAALLCEQPRGGSPCRTCRHCRKVLAGIHPDVTVVERRQDREGKLRREIVVDQIRALGADAAVLPNEAEGKVYILRDAETMNESAQNAFLKLLEEPPGFVSFLLCAANPLALLETVRSRCAEERLAPAAEQAAPQLAERARGFLDARKDALALLQWSLAMEKLDGAQLLEVVGCIRAMAVREADSGEVLPLEAFLARAEDYLRASVGVKHVTGYLATYGFNEK